MISLHSACASLTPTALTALMALALTACADPPQGSPSQDVPDLGMDQGDLPPQVMLEPLNPRFDPTSQAWYDTPWPSDHRLREGKVDLSKFPNANQVVLRIFRRALEQIEGFATMPVIYAGFDRAVAMAAMPQPARTLEPTSPVQLLDVSEAGCGQRVPVLVDMDTEGDVYIEPNVLRVSPVPGFILKPRRTYAMVVLRSFGQEVGLQATQPEALGPLLSQDGQDALSGAFKPLRDCMERAQLRAQDIALATVFTTQDPTIETRKLRDVVLDPARVQAPQVTEWALVADTSPIMNVYAGWIEAPIFQSGSSPYTVGGGLELDAQGLPRVQRYERTPVTLLVPKTLPQGKLPVMLWSDGTGAKQYSHVNDSIIQNLVRRGYGVLSFVPQFHDTRDPRAADDPITPTFNYLNPESGRTTFRQQAAEAIYMARVIREALPGLEGVPELDGQRILYGGHSQGAIVGALVAGVTDTFVAYALNGIGGYVSSTIIYRKDYTDIEKTLRDAVRVGRPLDRLHPIVQLGQLGIEVIDPHNYSPAWKGIDGEFDGSHVLLINGGQDATTARLGMDAVAIAGDVPPLKEAFWELDPYGVWGVDPIDVPASGNRQSVKGKPLTFGAYLLSGEGHFTIYRQPRATNLFVEFWDSAYKGVPTIK